MSCECEIAEPLVCSFPTGIPAGSSDRICLISGDGPPVANPPSIIHIWFYRDNLSQIIYPFNPQTAQWVYPDGTGAGGAGTTVRTCCNLIIAQGEPVAPPLTPAEAWWQIDPIAGLLYPWNPETAAWILAISGTGGAGSGSNNGLYWQSGAPSSPPDNIYVDNLDVDISNGVSYWWSWSLMVWE